LLAVRTRQRSGGVGAALLRAVENWGRANGAAYVILEFHAANTRAGEFYQRKLGYTVAAMTALKPL
jgi:ribosomal protein S18 acetylase RimI-like enzyme